MAKHLTQRLTVAILASIGYVYGHSFEVYGQVLVIEKDTTYCEMFRALSPEVPQECARVDRSIVIRGQEPAAKPEPPFSPTSGMVPFGATYERASTTPPRFALEGRERIIPFAFDSYTLLPESYPVLNMVAVMLLDPIMSRKTVRIVGHTCSIGSDEYNKSLSRKRAEAVQEYLHTVHGIPKHRIPVDGKGKSQLLDRDHPTDGVNRRVQFVNVTDM